MAFLSSFYPQPVVKGTTAGTYAEGNDSRFGDGLAEAPEDGIIYGRKDADWVDITAPANLQIRRGTAAEVAAITPLDGEPVWETDTKKLVIGDGLTLGGINSGKFPLDGTVRAGTNSTPTAGSIYVSDEVENRGGLGSFRPHVAGNARGNGAVDLQMQRNVSTMVAAGNFSAIIAGFRNTIASGQSGLNSVILASSGTTVNSASSCAINCGDKTISGNSSFSVNSNISGDSCVAFHGTADRRGLLVQGNTGFVTGFGSTERAQAIQIVLKGRTTNATPAPLVVEAPSVYFTIPTNVALFGIIEICAIEETNATENAHYFRKFAIQNLGGTTSLIGSVTTIGTDEESDAGYGVSITADDTSDSLQINVTGDSSKTLRWVATIRGTEMDIA